MNSKFRLVEPVLYNCAKAGRVGCVKKARNSIEYDAEGFEKFANLVKR